MCHRVLLSGPPTYFLPDACRRYKVDGRQPRDAVTREVFERLAVSTGKRHDAVNYDKLIRVCEGLSVDSNVEPAAIGASAAGGEKGGVIALRGNSQADMLIEPPGSIGHWAKAFGSNDELQNLRKLVEVIETFERRIGMHGVLRRGANSADPHTGEHLLCLGERLRCSFRFWVE